MKTVIFDGGGVIFENSDDLYDFGEVRVSGLRGDDAARAVREEVPRVDGRAFDGGLRAA